MALFSQNFDSNLIYTLDLGNLDGGDFDEEAGEEDGDDDDGGGDDDDDDEEDEASSSEERYFSIRSFI